MRDCQADLLDVVATGCAASGFPRSLNGGDQQRDQDSDDGDDDEQLNQREAGSAATPGAIKRRSPEKVHSIRPRFGPSCIVAVFLDCGKNRPVDDHPILEMAVWISSLRFGRRRMSAAKRGG